MMARWLKRIGAYLLAALSGYALAAIACTQSVLAHLADMGVTVTLGQRLAATGHDLLGMSTLYLPLIAGGFLLALPIAALLSRWFPGARSVLFALAGATAIVTVNVALDAAFQITPIAAARSLAGLMVQGLAGAVGGWLYARLMPAKT